MSTERPDPLRPSSSGEKIIHWIPRSVRARSVRVFGTLFYWAIYSFDVVDAFFSDVAQFIIDKEASKSRSDSPGTKDD